MENYIESIQTISQFTQTEFGSLSPQQFNFKPADNKWSIGQCIHHLVRTNKAYFPLYDKLLKGNYTPNFFEKNGWFAEFWEKFFINGVDPKNTKKMKAPATIQPEQSDIDMIILNKFYEQNLKIQDYYQKIYSNKLEKQIISSPFAKFITYSSGSTFEIIRLHELRHLQQAQRVKQLIK